MTSKVIAEIERRVFNGTFKTHDQDRASVDALLVLSEAAEEKLPKHFLDVLRAFHKKFNLESTNATQEFKRLHQILNAYQTVLEEDYSELDLGLLPTFSLEADDRARVIKLCSDMRKIVLSATEFDHPHKVRLGNRIAAIEAEVHKEKGLFDVVLGGVNDVGETLGKFGKDIKPLTDRMNEVMKITRKTSKEYEQLPIPEEIKQLPAPDDEFEE